MIRGVRRAGTFCEQDHAMHGLSAVGLGFIDNAVVRHEVVGTLNMPVGHVFANLAEHPERVTQVLQEGVHDPHS